MKQHVLTQELSDSFLRSNGTPAPPSCTCAEETCPCPCPVTAFSSPETLTPFLSQKPCPPFSLLAIHMDGVDARCPGFLTDMLGTLQEEIPCIQALFHEQSILFLLLPESAPEEAARLFSRIQARRTEAPVNAGLFQHPLPGFPPDQALTCARKALAHSLLLGQGQLTSFDAVSLNISGDEAYHEGRIQDAITEYEAALTLDPDNANVLNSLGVCFGTLQDHDRALTAFTRSFQAKPTEAMALYNQGLIHELRGDTTKARTCFENALPLEPDCFACTFHLGRCLMDLKQVPESIGILEKARTLRPENGPTLGLLAECHLLCEDIPRAFALFRQALRRMPRDAAILSGLGACFDAKGENPDIAATFCEEALSLEPDNGLFALRLARIRLRQKREEEAAALFAQARNAGWPLKEGEDPDRSPSSP